MQSDALAYCLKTPGGIEAIAQALTVHFSGVEGIDILPMAARALIDIGISMSLIKSACSADAQYLSNFNTLRSIVDWKTRRVRPDRMRSSIVSPDHHDMLVNILPLDGWGPIALLTHAALSSIRPRKQSAVVVTMRDDGISILEWVAHYRAIGFDAIFVYSNDNDDGSDELLSLLADHGIITFIRNHTTQSVSPQRKAFAHSLHFLPELRNYRWIFYADSDEYLILDEKFDFSIQNVLTQVAEDYPENLPSAICYHWMWYISNYAMTRIDGMMLERFPYMKPSPFLVKSIVNISDVISMRILHFPEVVPEGFFVDSARDVIESSVPADKQGVWQHKNNRYKDGRLNHYWCKSFEEFLIKKRRGDNVRMPDESNDYKRDIGLFFEWNGRNERHEYMPPPAALLGRVSDELFKLRMLDSVLETEAEIRRKFRSLVATTLGSRTLREVYDEVALQTGTVV